jgi:carboxylesterase type B
MRHLFGFSLIMLLILAPSCKWLREKGLFGKKADTMIVWKARQDSIRVADSVRKAQEHLVALEAARLDSLKKVQQEWENKNRYNIIIGSFITPEYARKYSADFAAKGYKTRIMKLEGTQFEMVSAEAHESVRTALARLKQFQDSVAFDSWIYIYKAQN